MSPNELCPGCGEHIPADVIASLPSTNSFKSLSKEELLKSYLYLKTILATSHGLLLSLRRSLVDRYLEEQDFEKAYIVAQEDLEGIDMIKELKGTTTRTVLLFLLFRLCVERDSVDAGLINRYGLEALEGFEITHGSQHEFCKEIRATLESLKIMTLENELRLSS